MAELTPEQREALEDLLCDLQHDLGKYLRLPLSFLPAEAGQEELRIALGTALRETRRSPAGVRAARDIWSAFAAEAGADLAHSPAYAALAAVVERALAWERALDRPGEALDRDRIEADLAAVRPAIRDLIEELHGTA